MYISTNNNKYTATHIIQRMYVKLILMISFIGYCICKFIIKYMDDISSGNNVLRLNLRSYVENFYYKKTLTLKKNVVISVKISHS